MFELFVHGRDKLNPLLNSDSSWEHRMRHGLGMTEFRYSKKDTPYFVNLTGCERDKSVMVDARLPLSATADLKIKVGEKTMEVVQDDGTTLQWPLELILMRSTTHIAIMTANPTDAGTLDCILEAFVKAIIRSDGV